MLTRSFDPYLDAPRPWDALCVLADASMFAEFEIGREDILEDDLREAPVLRASSKLREDLDRCAPDLP